MRGALVPSASQGFIRGRLPLSELSPQTICLNENNSLHCIELQNLQCIFIVLLLAVSNNPLFIPPLPPCSLEDW